ncbi:Fungal specific transcription factor domain [Ceratobasidium sp. AG-Ba]|nr:Fungal specific transcription factor domain [Ceratobasidium sp. AG-Ba]
MLPLPERSTPTGRPQNHKACNFCRARKRKCDGVRPICGYCRSLKHGTCTFEAAPDGRRSVSRSYVSALEARIKALESMIIAAVGEAAMEPVGGDTITQQDQPSSAPTTLNNLFQLSSSEILPEDSGASDIAMLDFGRLRLCMRKIEKGSTLNEGDTSNFCYAPTTGLQRADADEPEPSSTHLHLVCDSGQNFNIRTSTGIAEDEHELALLNKFWIWQDIHRTVVNRTFFLKSYREGERDSEWVSPMLIEMMLAIGEQFGYQGHGSRTDVHSARAEAMVVHELVRPRMATMQAIQLMSIFHMGTGKPSVAWSLNGLAVALSNRLGLHIDSTGLVSQGIMSKPMKDMRDALFWDVFVLDRLFSIIMGVHPLQNRRFISTRRPTGGIRSGLLPGGITLVGGEPDGTLTHDTPAPVEITSIWIRDLCDAVETMLLELYALDSPDRTPNDELNTINKNAGVIQTYMDNLPNSINVDVAIQANNLRPISLHIFLNLFIIMLNRPFLGRHRTQIAPPADQDTERRYRSLAFSYCRTAALRILALVEYFMHSPCFTTAHDIFAACTILLLSPDDPEAMKGVRLGLEYLDRLEKSYYWVGAADDARKRIWALAKRWNVTPLVSGESSPEIALPSNSASENARDQSQSQFTTSWDHSSSVFGWAMLNNPGLTAPFPKNIDANLDTTIPSIDVGLTYNDLGLQIDPLQQADLRWFMNPQTLSGFWPLD